MREKIKSLEELKKIVETLKSGGKRVVFTNGCFDLLHVGHVRYLEKAKRKGDILIVGLNSDESVKKLKGKHRPIVPQGERAEVLAALEAVDYVVIFPETDPVHLISQLLPDVLVKGGDYKLEEVLGRDIVNSRGGETVVIPPVPGWGTSIIIERILRRKEKVAGD